MNKIFLIPIILIISMSVSCVSSKNIYMEESKYLLYTNDRYSQNVDRFSIEIIYKNTDSKAHCISAFDMSDGVNRSIRIYENGSLLVPREGVNASRSLTTSEVYSPMRIIPPGRKVTAFIPLYKIYDFTRGNSYEIQYTIPVTQCTSLLSGVLIPPRAFDVRHIDSQQPVENWSQKLELTQGVYSSWAVVGFFAEMTHVKF